MADKRLDGRVVLVTGAAQGIGAVYARRLVAEGAKVVVADVDEPGAQRTASEVGALAVQVDVSNVESVTRMVETALDEFGRIDVLVNNAAVFGTLEYQPIEDIS